MTKSLSILLAIILTGCATHRPDLSREEWKNRDFEGVSREKVVAAAREVVRLADPGDVTFKNTSDGFSATRTAMGYYVVQSNIDSYTFKFSALERDGNTRSRLEIEEAEIKSSLLSLGLPVGEIGKPGSPYIYDLFFSRVEFLLGLKESWHKCEDAVSRVSARFGLPNDARQLGMASLCGTYSEDNMPNSASGKIELF